MTYRLSLAQSGFSGGDLARATGTFRKSLEHTLGGPDEVASAYRACAAVIGPDSRVPMLPGASYEQQQAVLRWRRAVCLAFVEIYRSFQFDGDADELAEAVGAAHVRMFVDATKDAHAESV